MPERMRLGTCLSVAGILTSFVLLANASMQIVDTNFIYLSEAVALLAGDHPYRDFFESGTPAAAYLSALAQSLTGYRLIGEFLLQWAGIVAGTVLAFRLGLRVSGSAAASFATLLVALPLVAYAPTYHYPKLLIFPIALWSAWRYLDRPGLQTSAVMGAVTAVAFLFRHDFLMYAVALSAAALLIVLATAPAGTGTRRFTRDALAAAAAATVTVSPWMVVVHAAEGLPTYIRTRTEMYESPGGLVYSALRRINPFDLAPSPPPPTPGTVRFIWNPDRVDATLQRTLEQRYRLRPMGTRDARGRLEYEAADIFDPRLLELDGYINDGAGFDWDRLQDIQWGLPPRDNALGWLTHVMLLIPLVLIAAGGIWLRRASSSGGEPHGARLMVAGIFLAVIDSSLFRQPSYLVTVAPLTLALASWTLARGPVWGRIAAAAVLSLTGYAAVVWTRDAPMYRPARYADTIPGVLTQMTGSPPVNHNESLRFLGQCTAPDDRLLVTGSTPFDVHYYSRRSIAGGHVLWHFGWRSHPAEEARSLALLQQQSVPFVISTSDPLPLDFKSYPRIQAYLDENFRAVDGFGGKVFVNRHRAARRTIGNGVPCFQ